MAKKRKRIKWKNAFIFLGIILCIYGLIYGIVNVIIWKIDNNRLKDESKEIKEIVTVEELEDTDNTEIIEQEEIDQFNPYWDYIKMGLINVDFKELKEKNSDTVGWIQVLGTNINYPFVQTSDNSFYLTHSFNKSSNQAGWVFLDYRNNNKEYDKNTIIYGHYLTSGAVFGTLQNILKTTWQSDTNNHVVKLSTEYENTLWQVFSVYTIPTTSDYLQINFNSDKQFVNFAQKLIDRSAYNFNTSVNENDKIITLSSCYKTSDYKVVLHAKLIKRELKQ